MATGIDRFNEIYDNGIKSGENKGKAVKNSEQVDRFNAMYEKSGAGYIAYKKYMENAAKLSQEIQSDYADRAGQWQSAETLAQNKADTLAAFNQLGNKDALLSYGYAISDPKQRRAYFDSILSVDDYKGNILQSHDDESAFYGQWKSDDEYKKSEAYFVSTYNDSLPDWEEKSKAEQKIFATPKGIFSSETGDAYAYINNLPVDINQVNGFSVNGYRSYWDAINDSSDNRDDSLYIYRYMTDDDILRYNYIFHTEGKDEADKFISSIQNRLNYEFGTEVGKRVSSTTLGKIVMPFAQGWDQSIMGMKGLFAEGELPISPYAVAGERVRDSIHTFDVFGKDFGQVLYDLGVTTANMLPYIMISSVIGGAIGAVNPLAGKIVSAAIGSIGMGASAAGNARQEALRQGYTQEQAWAYGLTVGALEGGLQFALGGIGKLGGKASSVVLKKLGSTSIGQAVSRYIANLSNGTLSAVLQAGGKLAGNMASEGFEEYLQDVINPLVRNITLGEDNEWGLKNFVSEDAIYSGILGALSAGVLESGSTVSGVYNAHKAGQAALDSGVYKGAIDYAKLLDPECDAYQIASELQSGKRKENAANIGALYEAVSEYIAESKKLVKKGKMTTDQYAGGVEALRQLADVRAGADAQRAQQMKAAQPSSAEVQTAANAASAPVLDSAVYDAVRAVESNENSAVKAANIIARIESGNSKISAAELSYISSPATKARQILQQRTGIDMGTTASQARNAVKEYISQRSASVSQETVNKRSAELRGVKAQSAAVNNDLSASLGFDAGTVGSAGTEAYTNHYSALKTEQGQRYFNSAFAKLYQAGMQGVPFKKISGNPDLQGMSVSTQAEIYNAAAKDYQAVNQIKAETKKAVHDRVREIRQRVREQKNGKVKKEYAEIDKKLLEKREVKAGTFTIDERIDRAKLSGKQKAAVKYLKALSEVAGVSVNIYSGVDQNGTVTAENGYYDPQTNTIYVSVNAGMSSVNAFAESAILRTASHEITHMIKASGTELYVDLRDYVIDTYVQEYGQNGLTERILDIQERHREIVGKELTYEQAEEELVSSACEMMLKNSKAFEKLAKRNLTLAQRVKSALDAFISRAQKMLSEAFEGNSANSAEARLMQASVERMEKLQQLWDRALLDAVGRETQGRENIKFSFAGTAAKNANLSLLAQAQIKIENGENAETVRQETGWYKGYDGKWRFEIDDSEITLKEKNITSGTAKIGDVLADCELLKAYPQLKDITISARPMLLMGNTNGWFSAANHEIVLNSRFLENAQVNRELKALYKTNEYKEYNAQMKKAADERSAKRSEIVKEYQELCNSKEYADYTERWSKADDADNKALMNRIEREWMVSETGKRFYELQKQLEEITEDRILETITDEFQQTETGKRYLELVRVSQGTDIVNNEATKKVLLHELQHAVQQIEEFASGASAEFWIEQTKNAEREFKKADIRLDKKADSVLEVLERYGFNEMKNNDFYLLSEEGMDAAREFLENTNAPREAAKLLDQLKEYQADYERAYENFKRLDKAAPMDLYTRTAGEIEARDAAARLSYDMEKRQNTRPDIDQKDVVFADGTPWVSLNSDDEIVFEPYSEYREDMLKLNDQNIIARSKKDVVEFVDEAFNNKQSKKSLHLGKVSDTTLQRIYQKIDNLPKEKNGTLFVAGREYSLEIGQEDVRHLIQDKKGLSKNDVIDYVLNLPQIISTFDTVSYTVYQQGANKLNGLLFKKQFSDGQYIAMEVVSKKNSQLQTHNIYMNRSDYGNKKKALKTMSVHSAQDVTSETLANPPSNINISNSDKNVNRMLELRENNVENKDQKHVVFADGEIVFYASNEEKGTIKDQLKAHLIEINKMNPVASIINEGRKGMNREQQVDAIMSDYNRKFKGGVPRKNFGFVEINENLVRGSLRYIYTDAEYAAFYAIPNVIKNGIEISEHRNHKGRSYETLTIAAPVNINGSRGNVAVVVKQTGKNRYKTHRILMPDGSEFILQNIKNEELTGADMLANNNNQGTAISSSSIINIPNYDENVNKMLELRENPAQKKFESDVDAVMNGTYKSNSVLVLGRTPKSLEAIGLNALPVAITPNHVYSIAATEQEAVRAGRYRKGTNYHGLGADAVKQIYQKLSDPIAVIAHPDFAVKNKRDSVHKVVVLVDLSVKGKQVIAPIAVDYEGIWNKTHIDVNLVASYFDKSNISDFLKEAVALETNHKVGFFYGKKERIRQLLMSTGHQLPRELNNSDSDIIIRRIDENVNREINSVLQSRQFIRWFGDWQNNPQNASKVVSEDGTPKMVYRGSKSDFVASELRNNQEITHAVENGFYFTDMYSGDNASEPVYLNIRNPFVLTDKNRQTAQRDILLGNYDGIIDADNGAYFVYRAEQVKSAVDNIGTFDGKNADIRYELRISEAVEKAIRNKGQLETEYNQQRISPVPENIAKMVLRASNGKIDIAGKYFAVSGGDLYHEYVRHSNAKTEQSRNQIALTAQDIKKAVQIFYQPDIVECIFEDGDNPSGRKSFAFAKKDSGYILVVESVGGRHNPNIVPVMILHVTEGKWQHWIDSGKSIAEMVYENSPKYLAAIKNNTENIKNRVTAARFAESQPPLNAPRSPRSNAIISGLDGNVNPEAENIKNRVTAARFAEIQPPQNAPRSPRSDTIISGVDEGVNREQAQASQYSYDTLVRKPDMQVTPLRSVSPEKVKEYIADHQKFAREMMQLARKAGHVRNTEKTTWLRNNDLNSDIMISADSFKHSAARMDTVYTRVCMSMSDIVKNAVAVNELPPRQNTAGAYVLLGMAHDGKEYTAVRMVVNKKTWKMEDYHILYAVKQAQIKEKVSGTVPPGSSAKAISDALLSPKISIQDMLQLVKKNDITSSVLSEDVLQNLQTTRGRGLLGESVLYELRSDPAQAEWEKPITVEDVDTLRSVGRKSVNEFTSEDIQKTQKWAHKFYKELGEKSPFFRAWFGDWRAYDTTQISYVPVNDSAISRDEIPRIEIANKDTSWVIKSSADGIDETSAKRGKWSNEYHALKDIRAMVSNAVLLDTVVVSDPSKRMGKGAVFVHHLYAPVLIKNNKAVAKLYVTENITDSKKFYLTKIEKVSNARGLNAPDGNSAAFDTKISIAEIFDFVKRNDVNYEADSKNPVYFSPNSVNASLLNANGTPQRLYRWESKSGARTNFGEGAYFTASKALAERAGGKAAPAYVKLENPYTVYGTAFSKADYAEIGAWAGMQVSAKNVTEALQALGYDGVIARSASGSHPIATIVAFDTAQTKASENVGTFDRANADVRYELRSDLEQAEWEKPITVEDVNTLRSVGRKSVNEFTSEDIQKTQKWAHKFYQELGEKSPFFRAWFGDWRAYDTTPFRLKTLSSLTVLNRTEADIYFKKGLKDHSLFRGDVLNNDTKFKINIGQKVYNDTLTYAAREFSRNGDFNGYLNRISLLNHISAITRDAVLFDTIVAKENSVNPDQSFVHQFYDACQIGQQTFIVKLIVDELNSQRGTIRRSYNVNSIEISPAAVSQVYKPASTASNSGDAVSIHTVADLFALVKESDANFQPKAAAAALLNANGTPQQLYRWESANGVRTNFGEGTYFTASKALAERAGGKAAPAYVKLENPYTVYGTAFSKADYAEIGAWAGMQVSAKNVTEALRALGYDGVISRSTAGNHPILAAVAFDTAQTKSSENVGTFDNANADVRYELRENEQGELNDNEIKSIHRTRGMALIEQILNQVPKGERQSLADVFSFIYSKAINAESVHDLESLNGARAFPGKLLQLIYDAAKEDVQNYKLYKKKFFNDLDRRLNELKSKDYSQEIGEQGKLFESVEDWPVREIIEYNELSYKGNPEEVKKEIEKLSAQKREAIKFLNKLCQVSGIKIEINLNENPDKTADGGYSDYEKMIRISVDKKGIKRGIETGVLDTAAHEITHMLRHEAPEQYNALSDLVTQSYIQETSVEAYIGELKKIIERYNANNEHAEYLSYEQAENEFVCYACESMLRNSTVFENLAMRNQTLAQKLSEGLQQFIKRLKELLLQLRKRLFVWQGKNSLQKSFEGMEGLNDVAEVLASNVETLKGMQERWDAALIKTVENRTQFVADENHFRKALNEWKKMHRNETISFAEEEKLKRGVARQLFQNWTGEVPISGKLTQVEKVYSGEYEENGTGYWSQVKEGRYNEKKNENGQTIEFELGATKYTKFFSYGTQESLDNVINTDSKEAKRLKDNGEFSLEAALQNAKTFFRCEIPVRMEKGHDYIVEAIVCFPAEKDGKNGKVNYEYELNKIIKEAMRTGNPVIDSTTDRIFDDMVLYDVIKVVEKTDTSGTVNAPSDLIQNQSSENVGTFDRTNSDIRYELRENEQKVALGIWELEKIHMDNAKEVQEKFDSITAVKLENTATKLDKATREKLGNIMRDIYYDSMNASSVEKVRRGRDLFAKEEIQSIYDMAKEHVRKYINDLNQYRLNLDNAEFFAKLDERLEELKSKSQKDFSQEMGELGKLIEEIDKQPKQEIAEYEEIILPGDFDNLSPRLQNGIDFLDKLCQASGIRMEVQRQPYDAEKKSIEHGRYHPLEEKIYLYLYSNNENGEILEKINSGMLRTASHEMTHWIQASDTKLYELLHDYVIQAYIQQNSIEQYERRLELIKMDYDVDNPNRSVRNIEEEFVAFACEMMLENTKAFEELAKQNRTLAQKLVEGLKTFIERVRKLLVELRNFIKEGKIFRENGFEGVKADNNISQLFAESVKKLEYMQKLWDGALIEAVVNKSVAPVKLEGIKRFGSLSKSKQLDAVKAELSNLSGQVPISGTLTQMELKSSDSGKYGNNLNGEWDQASQREYTEMWDEKGLIEFELGSTKYTRLYNVKKDLNESGEISLEEAENSVKTFFRCSVPIQIEGKEYVADVIAGFPEELDVWGNKINTQEAVKEVLENRKQGEVLIDPTDYNLFYNFVLYDVLEIREKN